MTVDTQKLRELLEKATPGPWSAIGSAGYVQAGEGHPRHNILAVAYGHDGNHQINAPGSRENGEYIAAVNPAELTALLDELDMQREIEARNASLDKECGRLERESDRLRAQLNQTASMLQSACLVISDPEARAMALQQVRDARALLNPPAPPQGEKG